MVVPTASRSASKNRFFLLFIIMLFVAPLAVAWLVVGRWQPGDTVNHGELLHPAQPVTTLRFQQPNGQSGSKDFLQGHWTLMYLGTECDARCRQGLYNIRQVRLALGKDMQRAQSLFLLSEDIPADLLAWLAREHTATTIGTADTKTAEFFTQAFADKESTVGDWIYLVDPLGNLLMRYRVDGDPGGMLEDLERLFKWSKIG